MISTYIKEEKHIELFEISATLDEISTLLSMVTDELEDELNSIEKTLSCTAGRMYQ